MKDPGNEGLIKTGPSFPSSDLGQNGVQKAGTIIVLEQIYFLENRVDFVFVSNRVNKYYNICVSRFGLKVIKKILARNERK